MIEMKDIKKRFTSNGSSFEALKDVTITIGQGEFVSIVGQSGSGKSTLLSIIGGITPPIGMQVFIIAGMCRDVSLSTIFKGCWPFVVTQITALIILLFIPKISLLLPDLMMPYR